MAKLESVILGVEDVLLPDGKIDKGIFSEVTKFISYLRSKNIEFAIFTNRAFTVSVGRKSASIPLKDYLESSWGEINYFSMSLDSDVPPKPRKESTEYIINKLGWKPESTVYIGATESDMITAVNGGLLLLRATWWANNLHYGFEFDSPKDIARFIDTFCLRDHFWCHEINDGNFRFYALAPFSTMKAEYTLYSEDARDAAKKGLGHPDFWIGALISSLYFTGIHKEIDYLAVYPGHKAGSGNPVMDAAISTFGKCFRKNYIPDLIVRHETAVKSQSARNRGEKIGHINQLNTIKLNPTPQKTVEKNYARCPVRKGKRVMVIDDITTRGYSLESARAYLEQVGAEVILVSWLKTINTDIERLSSLGSFNPFEKNSFSKVEVEKEYSYRGHIIDHLAPKELTKAFSNYENWEWPK